MTVWAQHTWQLSTVGRNIFRSIQVAGNKVSWQGLEDHFLYDIVAAVHRSVDDWVQRRSARQRPQSGGQHDLLTKALGSRCPLFGRCNFGERKVVVQGTLRSQS